MPCIQPQIDNIDSPSHLASISQYDVFAQEPWGLVDVNELRFSTLKSHIFQGLRDTAVSAVNESYLEFRYCRREPYDTLVGALKLVHLRCGVPLASIGRPAVRHPHIVD